MSDIRPPDPFDRAILRIIQRDNRTPQRAIAAAVNLSTAAVQRRIAAMEKAGIIARNAAIVDPDAVDLDITAIVEVQLTDERSATVDRDAHSWRATLSQPLRHGRPRQGPVPRRPGGAAMLLCDRRVQLHPADRVARHAPL